jgi:sortase (surface protein transpeptidase)
MSDTVKNEAEPWLAIESPEFARRIGRLLVSTRRRTRRSIDDIVRAAAGEFDEQQLRRFERGEADLDESIVDAVCRLYNADLGAVLPARSAVQIANGRLTGNGVSIKFSPGDPTSLLVGYLRLIRSMRRQKKAPAIALRRDDILVLAGHLGVDGAEIVDRLTTLMGATASQRYAMALLFASGAIVIGLAISGQAAAQNVTSSGSATATTGHTLGVADVAANLADVAANVADATGLLGAVRMNPPVAIPAAATETASVPALPAIAVPPPNRSGCNPDPSEAVMSVVIPDISYNCPVYAGGQSLIDAGFVTLVTDAGAHPVLATRPGDPGTLWLAGHRTTHGGAFADVPALADGALITVESGDVVATYRVVGRAYVRVRNGRVVDGSGNATSDATWESVIRADRSGNLAPRLVLQTCEGENYRWMIYADLV